MAGLTSRQLWQIRCKMVKQGADRTAARHWVSAIEWISIESRADSAHRVDYECLLPGGARLKTTHAIRCVVRHVELRRDEARGVPRSYVRLARLFVRILEQGTEHIPQSKLDTMVRAFATEPKRHRAPRQPRQPTEQLRELERRKGRRVRFADEPMPGRADPPSLRDLKRVGFVREHDVVYADINADVAHVLADGRIEVRVPDGEDVVVSGAEGLMAFWDARPSEISFNGSDTLAQLRAKYCAALRC